MQLVYGNTSAASTPTVKEDNSSSSEDEDSNGDNFFRPKGKGNTVWLLFLKKCNITV